MLVQWYSGDSSAVMNRSCRYGTPPGYVTIPLREEGEESSTQPPLHISDHETVWIDVCPACRGDCVCVFSAGLMQNMVGSLNKNHVY